MREETARIALSGHSRNDAGDWYAYYDNARVDCERCEEVGGWTGADSGLYCPYGCGVRIISTQAEDSARFRAEAHVRESVRRERLLVRKAEREHKSKFPPKNKPEKRNGPPE